MVVGTLSARYGNLFLGHHYGDKFELHHHIEDGMVISDVAQISRSRLPLRHRDRCTWSAWCGPTSSAARRCLRRSWTAPSPIRIPLPRKFTLRTTVPFQGQMKWKMGYGGFGDKTCWHTAHVPKMAYLKSQGHHVFVYLYS